MPAAMGMAIAINFQMSDNQAAITGILWADEVNSVLKACNPKIGIAVTALHNHMLYDNPRLFMMHFLADIYPEKLAKTLKSVLDKTNSKSNIRSKGSSCLKVMFFWTNTFTSPFQHTLLLNYKGRAKRI